jgi:hypothetical protein
MYPLPQCQKQGSSHATGAASLHISSNCPLRYDIRHMTSDEQDDMIEKLLADHNAAMAATAASTQSKKATIIECEVSEEDFVRCSG